MKGLVITTSKSASAELIAGAKKYCEETILVVIGDSTAAVGTNKAYVLKCFGSRLAALPELLKLVEDERPDMVIVEQNIDGRYFSACIAAKLKTCVLTDCMSFQEIEGRVYSERMSYGGKAIKTECPNGKIVACIGSGVFESDCECPCEEIIEISCIENGGITTTDMRKKETRNVNLAAAKIVVGVGRGIGTDENLKSAQKLAEAIGAEIACTRPISEEEHWLERERYIGVSGKMIKPRLYIALGISGQIQHTVGVNGAGMIISFNRDKNAPMFKQSDYGMVADLDEVIPKLTELLT